MHMQLLHHCCHMMSSTGALPWYHSARVKVEGSYILSLSVPVQSMPVAVCETLSNPH